ncbi:MAG: hypothetical protein PHG05_04245 [Candidatus Nanoarchaeia archaeon]|nr:hypothetical protein [Candidatus Nanoarchaeia archaeon]
MTYLSREEILKTAGIDINSPLATFYDELGKFDSEAYHQSDLYKEREIKCLEEIREFNVRLENYHIEKAIDKFIENNGLDVNITRAAYEKERKITRRFKEHTEALGINYHELGFYLMADQDVLDEVDIPKQTIKQDHCFINLSLAIPTMEQYNKQAVTYCHDHAKVGFTNFSYEDKETMKNVIPPNFRPIKKKIKINILDNEYAETEIELFNSFITDLMGNKPTAGTYWTYTKKEINDDVILNKKHKRNNGFYEGVNLNIIDNGKEPKYSNREIDKKLFENVTIENKEGIFTLGKLYKLANKEINDEVYSPTVEDSIIGRIENLEEKINNYLKMEYLMINDIHQIAEYVGINNKKLIRDILERLKEKII